MPGFLDHLDLVINPALQTGSSIFKGLAEGRAAVQEREKEQRGEERQDFLSRLRAKHLALEQQRADLEAQQARQPKRMNVGGQIVEYPYGGGPPTFTPVPLSPREQIEFDNKQRDREANLHKQERQLDAQNQGREIGKIWAQALDRQGRHLEALSLRARLAAPDFDPSTLTLDNPAGRPPPLKVIGGPEKSAVIGQHYDPAKGQWVLDPPTFLPIGTGRGAPTTTTTSRTTPRKQVTSPDRITEFQNALPSVVNELSAKVPGFTAAGIATVTVPGVGPVRKEALIARAFRQMYGIEVTVQWDGRRFRIVQAWEPEHVSETETRRGPATGPPGAEPE